MAKIKIQLNSASNLRDVLQEAYVLTDELIIQVQTEITKLANSSRLQDEVMESRTKYAKAINDLLNTKEKAISKKLDIAKLLNEVMKYNGDLQKMQESGGNQAMSFDITKIRDIVNQKEKSTQEIKTIELKR